MLNRVIDSTLGLAKSWVGLMTGYIGATAAAILAFENLPEPLKSAPLWLRVGLLSAIPVLALVFHAIPELADQRRKKRLTEITGHLQTGYFQLSPRDNETSFTRSDGMHEEVLRWIEQRNQPVMYLSGLSGSGKSSLLAAWVLPKLTQNDTLVIRLRGYQNPVAELERALQRPGVIWQKPTAEAGDVRTLLERACRFIRPKRLLVVLDQFEEFVILQNPGARELFERLMPGLRDQPNSDLAFLFVFRSDYIGLIEGLSLPPLNQNTNWKEVPPFTESAARDFVRGSGLEVGDELLRDILREAAEIDQTKGIIRPVTINLCGLVLGRFATGLPRGFRPGGLIRGFLRESISIQPIRDIAPVLIPHLITGNVTKRPRSITELATATAIDPAVVRGCMRLLGQNNRTIVRPLDADQQTWEISHDFLVPLLDSIVARWKVSLWRRLRSLLPWIAAISMVIAVIVATNWRRNPILDLEDLGWKVHQTHNALELDFVGPFPRQSLPILRHISQPLYVKLTCDSIAGISDWTVLKNLTTLDLSGSPISDVSSLKDLKNLTTLDLSLTKVSNESLKDLGNLENLTTLKLAQTMVTEVSPLKDLKNLTTLDLNNTRVKDLSPLKDLKNLTTLDLRLNSTGRDVSSLKDLKNLTTLDLSFKAISDVSPLADLKNLTTLNLSDNNIGNLSPLKDLKNLTTLDLSYNSTSDNIDRGIVDLSPLKDLKNLTTLNLSYVNIRDLSPLRDLKNLTTLDLSYVDINYKLDLSPLKDLKNLTTLVLQHDNISDLSPLKDLKNLTTLDLSFVEVDVSPLKDLKNLRIEP